MSSKAEIGERAGVERRASNFTTQLYTVSYLILFSIFGTLARLGIQWLTFYPGAPVIFSELWANVGGSFIMGFLSNDTSLFSSSPGPSADEEKGAGGAQSATIKEPHPMHAANKKTIPLYIGLATGFCGSFTSFSSFMRDAFLALSNNLATPSSTNTTITPSRHNGYSVEALIAVLLTTTALSLAALLSGAHLALLLSPYTPTLPPRLLRRVLDPLTVFLALGAWLAALFMTIWPPDRPSGPQSRSGGWSAETWRGQALFACLFAPPGCLLRFLASLKLNALAPSFPLGTFAVNVFGTAVLGMAYDLQHVRLTAPGAMAVAGGGRIGCQVLQGIEDGFCGCVTTVSTWVAEMRGLRRGHAYVYGVGSVGLGVGVMVVVMGSVRWTTGFVEPICATGRG
ncbi:hypothetical protein K490DRAFT_40931 [Saccharata proteae CBS 121410]|uniref:CrcB-like protein-domain-containing protein n=1 Tax=Saccharata proteae CBS 121410 TaxID=1314787 RepID=A0A9P4M0D4_9PEZI|nr:hypothetical protein K490DRAFT_40931 [Saccharata proteae CBS 121410]